MASHVFKSKTLAIHAGQVPDSATGSRALPIYQTTNYVFDSAEHAASLFNLQTFGNVYSRLMALMTLLRQGDHVVAAGHCMAATSRCWP